MGEKIYISGNETMVFWTLPIWNKNPRTIFIYSKPFQTWGIIWFYHCIGQNLACHPWEISGRAFQSLQMIHIDGIYLDKLGYFFNNPLTRWG